MAKRASIKKNPITRIKQALDREQAIYNLAWDYCTRMDRNEAVDLDEYLHRNQLRNAADTEEFISLVNMHKLLSVATFANQSGVAHASSA